MRIIEEKMSKRGESAVNITFADNGYMLEASGRNNEDDWVNISLVLTNMEQLTQALETLSGLPKE